MKELFYSCVWNSSSHRGYIQYDIYDIRLIDGIDFFVNVFWYVCYLIDVKDSWLNVKQFAS